MNKTTLTSGFDTFDIVRTDDGRTGEIRSMNASRFLPQNTYRVLINGTLEDHRFSSLALVSRQAFNGQS